MRMRFPWVQGHAGCRLHDTDVSLVLQASNVATFIAHGDVALSVLMTTASTLGAIIMTPTLTRVLAGTLVPVDAWVSSIVLCDEARTSEAPGTLECEGMASTRNA